MFRRKRAELVAYFMNSDTKSPDAGSSDISSDMKDSGCSRWFMVA
jgi:hypothetical protein